MRVAPALHQIVPSLVPGDAVSHHVRQLRTALADLGWETRIFAEAVHPSLRDDALPIERLAAEAPTSALLYHCAVRAPSSEAALAGGQGPRGVVYHNFTPADFFLGVSRLNFERVAAARRGLRHLAGIAEVGICLSEFSRTDLMDSGFARTAVVPFAISDPDRLPARTPAPATVLGVGRLAPNKRWELALRAMAALRISNPEARFELVGDGTEMEPYALAVEALARRLEAGATLLGRLDEVALEEAFCRATALLLVSAHEGFALPLLEAMARGVPVVACRHGAVPETAGDVGLLCNDDPLEIAGALERVLDCPTLANEMAKRGRARARTFSAAAQRARLAAAIAPWE